jgi:Uma2 family endonuclease
MRPDSSGVKLTYDDFVLFPDDGLRHELIDGEHYVTPSPNLKHQAIIWNLTGMMAPFLREARAGRAFSAPFDVVFSRFDVVEPDLLFIAKARLDILTDKNVQGSPNLVVEVESPGTRKRDETIKKRLYEQNDVEEYWVIDPELDIVTVDRHVDGRYERAAELTLEQGDILTTPLLPGLELPLSRIFEN